MKSRGHKRPHKHRKARRDTVPLPALPPAQQAAVHGATRRGPPHGLAVGGRQEHVDSGVMYVGVRGEFAHAGADASFRAVRGRRRSEEKGREAEARLAPSPVSPASGVAPSPSPSPSPSPEPPALFEPPEHPLRFISSVAPAAPPVPPRVPPARPPKDGRTSATPTPSATSPFQHLLEGKENSNLSYAQLKKQLVQLKRGGSTEPNVPAPVPLKPPPPKPKASKPSIASSTDISGPSEMTHDSERARRYLAVTASELPVHAAVGHPTLLEAPVARGGGPRKAKQGEGKGRKGRRKGGGGGGGGGGAAKGKKAKGTGRTPKRPARTSAAHVAATMSVPVANITDILRAREGGEDMSGFRSDASTRSGASAFTPVEAATRMVAARALQLLQREEGQRDWGGELTPSRKRRGRSPARAQPVSQWGSPPRRTGASSSPQRGYASGSTVTTRTSGTSGWRQRERSHSTASRSSTLSLASQTQAWASQLRGGGPVAPPRRAPPPRAAAQPTATTAPKRKPRQP